MKKSVFLSYFVLFNDGLEVIQELKIRNENYSNFVAFLFFPLFLLVLFNFFSLKYQNLLILQVFNLVLKLSYLCRLATNFVLFFLLFISFETQLRLQMLSFLLPFFLSLLKFTHLALKHVNLMNWVIHFVLNQRNVFLVLLNNLLLSLNFLLV